MSAREQLPADVREALEFYAKKDTWNMAGVAWRTTWTETETGTTGDRKTDRGATARAVLARVDAEVQP